MDLLIVDRIEGLYAVCECADKSRIQLPLAELPQEIQEGDCLRPQADGYWIDQAETQHRRKLAAELQRRLMKPRPSPPSGE